MIQENNNKNTIVEQGLHKFQLILSQCDYNPSCIPVIQRDEHYYLYSYYDTQYIQGQTTINTDTEKENRREDLSWKYGQIENSYWQVSGHFEKEKHHLQKLCTIQRSAWPYLIKGNKLWSLGIFS